MIEEPGRDRNVRDDNKRTRTRNAFATTANPVRREYLGTTPKCTNCNLHHTPESLYRACFNYNHLGHLAKDCRVGPRMVNSVNARNPTAAHGTCFECSGTDHLMAACPRLNQEQRLGGGKEKRKEVEEVDKKYSMEVNRFIEYDEEFDWLFKHKAEIICHEKVVRIPLRNGKTHRFIGENLKEKVRYLVIPCKFKVIILNEAIRNGSLKKNTEKRCKSGEPSRDRNVRDDNKRTRPRNAFSTNANLWRREYTGTTPKCTNYNQRHTPESPCRACFNYNQLGHLANVCRVGPRMVNSVNARNPTTTRGTCFECGGTDHFKATCSRLNQEQRRGGGRLNQVMAIDRCQGHGNNGNWAHGGAFIVGADEAR
ncbi:reverse transcriptase domain-containing protein [Tanacetum coccineum]